MLAWMGIMLLGLCACGVQDKNQQDITSSNSAEEVNTETTKGIHVALAGEDEATITLNDKAIETLDSIMQGDEGQLVNEIQIIFFSQDEKKNINLNITDSHFNIYADNPNEQNSFWNYSDDDIEANRTDQSFSFVLRQFGIASDFKGCTDYRVEFYTFESGEREILTEGKVSGILSEKEKKSFLQVVFPNAKLAKCKVMGEEAKTAFYNHDSIRIDFFESEERLQDDFPCPILNINVSPNETSDNYRIANCGICTDSESRTFQDLNVENYGYPGITTGTEDGVTIQYSYKGIQELIKPEYVYQLYIGEEIVETGRLSDVILEEEYSEILPIPDWVPKNDKDSEFLIPDTKEYTITILEVPNAMMDATSWYQKMGSMVYGANVRIEIPLKVVVLDSFNEFGLYSSKIKIVYPTVEGAMNACAGYEMLVEQEQKDELVTAELFEECDQQLFKKHDYFVYKGHYDSVRYFEFTEKGISARLNDNTYGITMTNVEELCFDFNTVDIKYLEKQTSTQKSADYSDKTYELATYSTRNPDTRGFEEMKEEYNTAPQNWQDHPYVFLLPPIPDGLNLHYGLNSTINEENLTLCTDANGCTREQAEQLIGDLKNMGYDSEDGHCYYDSNEDEISIRLLSDEGVYVGMYWRKDEQSISINISKE